MRIGTWNLAGRWDARHAELIDSLQCDVLLLTEVSDRVNVPGWDGYATEQLMARRRHWAAIFARDLVPLADPHGASAAASVDGITLCSSILPWRSCRGGPPWCGENTAERTASAVAAVETVKPDIWGGDWNHALRGREYSGSIAGRAAIWAATQRLGLSVPTQNLPHPIPGLLTIDHIAVPAGSSIVAVEHHVAQDRDARLSDHDAYVVQLSER